MRFFASEKEIWEIKQKCSPGFGSFLCPDCGGSGHIENSHEICRKCGRAGVSDTGTLIRLLKMAIPDGYKFVGFTMEEEAAVFEENIVYHPQMLEIKNPYPVGTILAVCETYMISLRDPQVWQIDYKAEGGKINVQTKIVTAKYPKVYKSSPSWRSSARMPAIFSRFSIKITGVEVSKPHRLQTWGGDVFEQKVWCWKWRYENA